MLIEPYRGAMVPTFTGRLRNEGAVDTNGAVIIPTQANTIRGYELNSFINDPNIKLFGLVHFLYALVTHSITDYSYILSVESKLAPVRYSRNINEQTDEQIQTFNKVKEITKLLGIQPVKIDFTPLEITNCFDNMLYGVICEASRIYDENYAQFNLPRQIQVALVEHVMRLQNITYILQKNNHLFNDLNGLTEALEPIFAHNKTLEEFGELIHDVQKKESSGPYNFDNVGPEIKKSVQTFFLEPLKLMRFKNPNLKAKKVEVLYQERIKWMQQIPKKAETAKSYPVFQDLRTDFWAGRVTFQELLDKGCSVLYESTIPYNLHRLDKDNSSLYGPNLP